MAIEVEIDSVETEDSAPTEAPNRISKVPTKELLTFVFTVTADDVIRAWRARLEPVDHNTGTLLGSRGMVCGSGDVCGPDTFDLATSSPLEVSETTDPTELGEVPDGEYEVGVFAMQEGEWSS